MRLRLYHHSDGARVAYREFGAGPPLALLHSGLLSHKEWEPTVDQLADRFRVVLPDLPLHRDSENDPRHPYTPDRFAERPARLAHGTRLMFAPQRAQHLSVRGNPAAADLVRHAFADVPGNSSLARSWAKCARAWPRGAQRDLLELYPRLDIPVLLLWADRDP